MSFLSATSLDVYAELGCCLFLVLRIFSIIKFYFRFINIDSSRCKYKALQMLINNVDTYDKGALKALDS